MHKLFHVSTKAAIYNQARSHVIVIHMARANVYGLPGGHIEENESPDEAVSRELLEECGVISDDLRHVDFFVHSEGKIILAYVGTANSNNLQSQQDEKEGIPKWISKAEFETIQIEPNYRKFVIDNWP